MRITGKQLIWKNRYLLKPNKYKHLIIEMHFYLQLAANPIQRFCLVVHFPYFSLIQHQVQTASFRISRIFD